MALIYQAVFTYTLNGGGAELIDPGFNVKKLKVSIDDTGGECWVRAAMSPATAPSAPIGTPAPAADTLSVQGWIHLKGAGASFTFQADPFGFLRWVECYDIAAGGLLVDGSLS